MHPTDFEQTNSQPLFLFRQPFCHTQNAETIARCRNLPEIGFQGRVFRFRGCEAGNRGERFNLNEQLIRTGPIALPTSRRQR